MTTQTQASGLAVGATVYPAGDWLNTNFTTGGGLTNDAIWRSDPYWWVNPAPYWWPYNSVEIRREKVRLKLSEVERLREAVRKDEAAREVLNKLSCLIEIEVDF